MILDSRFFDSHAKQGVGENPQLELRPAPESAGRLHERGLVDSLLFTTKPAIPHAHPRPGEARSAVSKDGSRARAVRAAHGSRRDLLTMRSRCKSKMRSRLCKSPVFRLYYQEKTGADACKCGPSGLFFAQDLPVPALVYRDATTPSRLSRASWHPRALLSSPR